MVHSDKTTEIGWQTNKEKGITNSVRNFSTLGAERRANMVEYFLHGLLRPLAVVSCLGSLYCH